MVHDGPRPVPIAARFWDKVCTEGPTPPHCPELGACWPWIAAIAGNTGYGSVRGEDGKTKNAHTISYALTRGPIPPKMRVLHHCDNPPCVRPDHLFLGTAADNMVDMATKGRSNAKLSIEDLTTARMLYASGGYNYRKLARRFGVDPTTMANAIRGKYRSYANDFVVAKA